MNSTERRSDMGDVIEFRKPGATIDITRVRESARQLREGMILPAENEQVVELAQEHKAEPIKSLDDIQRISNYLISQKRYRDNMLFVCGINFGLRVSDLLQLTFGRLIDDSFQFRTTFPILEIKTRNTRKVQKNRYITINDAVVDAVTLYLEKCPGKKLDDYMFRSESNRSTANTPLSRMSVDRIMKSFQEEIGIEAKLSSHSLRKTFGYHQMVMSGNDPRKLLVLQKMFGHSSAAQTLDYIGITNEEIEAAYLDLNLAGKNTYARFNRIAGETA